MYSFLMTLKNSWMDSLPLFKPTRDNLFLLVTLKTIVMTYKQLALSCWPAFIVAGALMYFVGMAVHWVAIMAVMTLLPLIFLAVRPSTELKTYPSYYFRYNERGYSLILVLFFIPILMLPENFIIQWYALFFVFLMFFLADDFFSTDGVVYKVLKALRRTAILLLYNAPFLIVWHAIFLLLYAGLHSYVGIPNVYLILVAPVPLSLFNNFYIKQVHEQFNLYA